MAQALPDPRVGTFAVPMRDTFVRVTRLYKEHVPGLAGTLVTPTAIMSDDFTAWLAEFAFRGLFKSYRRVEVVKVGLKYVDDEIGYLFVFDDKINASMFGLAWAGK